MKKFIAVLISIFISLSIYSLAYADRECVGTTVVKDDMVFINKMCIRDSICILQ